MWIKEIFSLENLVKRKISDENHYELDLKVGIFLASNKSIIKNFCLKFHETGLKTFFQVERMS